MSIGSIDHLRKCRSCNTPVMFVGTSNLRMENVSGVDWLHAVIINGELTLIHDYNGCTDSYPDLVGVRGLSSAEFLIKNFYSTVGRTMNQMSEPPHYIYKRIKVDYPTYNDIMEELHPMINFLYRVTQETFTKSQTLFFAYPEKCLLDILKEVLCQVVKHLQTVYKVPSSPLIAVDGIEYLPSIPIPPDWVKIDYNCNVCGYAEVYEYSWDTDPDNPWGGETVICNHCGASSSVDYS